MLRSPELRAAIFAYLGQSQARAGNDILPRARELANIRASSTTLRADVALLLAQPGAADIRRVAHQQSVQKSITQLAGDFADDNAGFRSALEELLKDQQDVGIDLPALIGENALGFHGTGSKEGILLEVLTRKTDLKSLDVQYRNGHPVDVQHILPALATIQANNPALEALCLDFPASIHHTIDGRRTPVIVHHLPQLGRLTRLNRLNLRSHSAGPALVPALAALTGLTSLDVASNRLDATSLAGLTTLSGLTSLSIAGAQMDTAALGTTLDTLAGALTGLTSLDVGYTARFGRAEGTQLIAALNGFSHLSSLGVAASMLYPDDMHALAATHPGLASLDLGWSDLPHGCLSALATLPRLASVNVSGIDLSLAQVSELATLPNLRQLIIRHSHVDDAVAAALAELTNLALLDMRDRRGPLSQASRDALHAMPNLRKLHI